jgi:putative oxidoreductase
MNTSLTPSTARRLNIGFAVLRIVVGIIFVAHGGQKLFIHGFGGVAGAFTNMGIPLPAVTSALVILIEFFGGLALLLGLFTRFVALPLAAVMLGAMLMVHLPAGFFLPNGIEFTLILLASLVLFALTGPGALAVDNVLAGRRDRTLGGSAA